MIEESDIQKIKCLRPDIDPIRSAFGDQIHLWSSALDRFRWNISRVGRGSRRMMLLEKDKYYGKKAVILCNGPSLNLVDFNQLCGVFCIGLNKVNLLFERTLFRPDIIVAVNRLVIEQNQSFFNSTSIPLYISSVGKDVIQYRENIRFLHVVRSRKFARDTSGSVAEGATVTYVALQLAFHLGFTEVALVGCDHNFAVKGSPNKTVTSQEQDKSHFDPNYFGPGIKWQLPDLEESEASYRLALLNYAAFGRRVVNATEGGKLEVYPRISLQEFLKQ